MARAIDEPYVKVALLEGWQMKLYRGDSVPRCVTSSSSHGRGRTFAEFFCGNGLMAKYSQGGRPEMLAGKDLLQLVVEHVGYTPGTVSAELAYHSPMLSFTSSLERAFAFCERTEKKRLRLEGCPFEQATHFIWELDIELSPTSSIGLYHLVYEADPANCREITEEHIRRGLIEEATTGNIHALASGIRDLLAQQHAASDEAHHHAMLVDVRRYVEHERLDGRLATRDQQLVGNCLERSRRDREWLLYPMDPMPDGYGLSGRIWMNRYLRPFAWLRHTA